MRATVFTAAHWCTFMEAGDPHHSTGQHDNPFRLPSGLVLQQASSYTFGSGLQTPFKALAAIPSTMGPSLPGLFHSRRR